MAIPLVLAWPLMLGGDADLATHVRLGREVLTHGFPTVDPILAAVDPTAPEWHRAFVLHEWGFEVAVAAVHRGFGFWPILVAGVGAVAAAFGLAIGRAARDGAGAWPLLLTVAAALPVIAVHTTLRPHVVTWVLLVPWVAWWTDRSLPVRALAMRSLPVMVLWANVHGGFLYGLLFAGLATVAAVPSDRRRAAGLAGVLALAVGAACVGPYGPRLLWHLAAFSSDEYLRLGTKDLRPPDPTTLAGAAVLAFVVFGVVAAAAPRPGRVLSVLQAVVFGVLAARSIRHGAVLAIVVLPATAAGLQAWITHLGLREIDASSSRLAGLVSRGGWGWATLVPACVAVALGAVGVPGSGLPPTAPLAALAALDDDLGGTAGFTDYAYGGFVAFARPDLAPFVHPLNALYPSSRLEDYVAVDQALDVERIWRREAFAWVLVRPESPLVGALDGLGCTVTHQDPQAVVARCQPSRR